MLARAVLAGMLTTAFAPLVLRLVIWGLDQALDGIGTKVLGRLLGRQRTLVALVTAVALWCYALATVAGAFEFAALTGSLAVLAVYLLYRFRRKLFPPPE